MKLNELHQFYCFYNKLADSLFNSFTASANDSGLTPFSTRAVKIESCCLSNPQFKI
jgi:hypothetical protein